MINLGSASLKPGRTFISNPGRRAKRAEQVMVKALADSGCSVSILSYNLASRINLHIMMAGNARLKDASDNKMDISGKGALVVQEEHGCPYDIKVRVSRSLGQEELMMGWGTSSTSTYAIRTS